MLHLDDGVLRRLYDDPQGTLASARRHCATCTVCRRRAAELAENARAAAAALDDDVPPADIVPAADVVFRASGSELGAALDAVRARADRDDAASTLRSIVRQPIRFGTPPRYAALMIGLAAAAAIVLAFIFTPLSTVGQNFLTIFEPQQFTPIAVTRLDRQAMRFLPPLQAYGTLLQISKPQTTSVSNAAKAASLAHMPVKVPQVVPPDVSGAVRFAVSSPGVATFTFSAAKARAAVLAAHRRLPMMPPGLDGSTLQVSAGPIVEMTFGGRVPRNKAEAARQADNEEFPELLIAQAPMPRVISTGASVRQIEQYLLSIPGVPRSLAAQVAAIGDPTTTLPIPVPIDKATAQSVIVQGVPGLAVGDNTGVGAGVVWQQNGYIYGVTGSLPESEILAIANSLR